MIEDSHNSRTNLSELGEFGLIDLLTKNLEVKLPSTIKGIGDDAAVMDFKDQQTIVSTDLLVEGVHFDLAYMP
jgi:thiamine-monophosphate kinase